MRPLVDSQRILCILRNHLTGYKAKIGKKEQYLKDETSFARFVFDWAHEQTESSSIADQIVGFYCMALLY